VTGQEISPSGEKKYNAKSDIEIPSLGEVKAGSKKPVQVTVYDAGGRTTLRTYNLVDENWTVLDLVFNKEKKEGKESYLTINGDGSLNFDQKSIK